MSNRQQDYSYRYHVDLIFVTILSLMLFCSIATIFWGADRSLGLADEGLYLLASRYPEEIQQNVSSVYIYTGYLFRITNFSPMAFRLLGVILVCTSAPFFWWGFYKYLIKFYPNVKAIKYFRYYSLLFIELGAILHYQWFYLTPNYNTLIAVAINTLAGSIMFGIAQIENWQKNKKSIIIAFICGGLSIGLALFTKFPAGICFLFLFLLVIVLHRGIKRYQTAILSAAVLAGISIWFFGHFIFVQPHKVWWQMFKEGWRLYQAFGAHTPQFKSLTYVNDISFFVYSAIKIFWPCYLLICLSYLFFILRENGRKLIETSNSITIFAVMLIAVLLSVKAGVVDSHAILPSKSHTI